MVHFHSVGVAKFKKRASEGVALPWTIMNNSPLMFKKGVIHCIFKRRVANAKIQHQPLKNHPSFLANFYNKQLINRVLFISVSTQNV